MARVSPALIYIIYIIAPVPCLSLNCDLLSIAHIIHIPLHAPLQRTQSHSLITRQKEHVQASRLPKKESLDPTYPLGTYQTKRLHRTSCIKLQSSNFSTIVGEEAYVSFPNTYMASVANNSASRLSDEANRTAPSASSHPIWNHSRENTAP